MKKTVLIILIFTLQIGISQAQNVSNLGKDFWFGFMQNYVTTPTLTVRIPCNKNTTWILEILVVNYIK